MYLPSCFDVHSEVSSRHSFRKASQVVTLAPVLDAISRLLRIKYRRCIISILLYSVNDKIDRGSFLKINIHENVSRKVSDYKSPKSVLRDTVSWINKHIKTVIHYYIYKDIMISMKWLCIKRVYECVF